MPQEYEVNMISTSEMFLHCALQTHRCWRGIQGYILYNFVMGNERPIIHSQMNILLPNGFVWL
jgi:hypothetical protein